MKLALLSRLAFLCVSSLLATLPMRAGVQAEDVDRVDNFIMACQLYEGGQPVDAEKTLASSIQKTQGTAEWYLECANGILQVNAYFRNRGNTQLMAITAERVRLNLKAALESLTPASPAWLTASVYENLGAFYEKFDGDKNAALAYYEKALAVNPNAKNIKRSISRIKQAMDALNALAAAQPRG